MLSTATPAGRPGCAQSGSEWQPSNAQTLGNHEVANQPPPLVDYNVFESDRPLVEAVAREGAEWARERIAAVGEYAGSGAAQELGRLANENGPKLRTHDRFGNRVDVPEFHPAWHELLGIAVANELHSSPWKDPRPGAHVARGAAFMCMSHAEAGIGCPISMTYSVIPALRTQPELAAEWEPRFLSATYDPANAPADGKAGALAGMGMTEKQGGTDVRANTTLARPVNGGGPGAEYELTGHKWFMSAPQCDAFLVLAQADGGISCFLFPRWTPDGARNRFRLQRLKDKLGNRSNASSEVEFDAASAWLVGEEGAGVRTIIEMVNHTRLDCVIGGATGMRAGVAQAIHHTTHRSVFGRELVEQPLMRNVLADLAIESEAATISALRLARAYDEAIAGDEEAQQLKRVANAVLKYWICKRAVMHAGECARVPRRQRLRRGVGDAAPLPREPAELDLGGLRQRPVPRRPAGDGQEPHLARRLLRRGRGGRGRRAAPRRLRDQAARRATRRPGDDPVPRPPRGRAHGPRPPSLAPGPLRRRSDRRRLLRLPPLRRLGPSLRHPPRRHRLRPHHRAPPRTLDTLRLLSGYCGEIVTFRDLTRFLPEAAYQPELAEAVPGVRYVEDEPRTFVEPNLEPMGDAQIVPEETRLVLISAPAAVGKSTLARAIAAEKGAVLWDLGMANVGDNFFSGQILRSFAGDNGYKYLQALGRGKALVVMDAFDEAWVKAGDDNVQGFLETLAAQLREFHPAHPPVVLLARSEAAGFAEDLANDVGLPTAHFSIAYFERAQAEEFIDLKLDGIPASQHRSHRDAFDEVRDLLFDRVFQVLGMGDWNDFEAKSFLGYAPVLDALSEFLNTNYASVKADLSSANDDMAGETIWRFLVDIIERILSREKEKLNLPEALQGKIPLQTRNSLYGPEEQCARLASLVLEGLAPECEIPPEIREEYEESVQQMLTEHPFLATPKKFASAVFGDYIWARALQNPLLNEPVRTRLAHSIGSPLLARFMIETAPREGETPAIPLRDFPVFYESVRIDPAGQPSLSIRQLDGRLESRAQPRRRRPAADPQRGRRRRRRIHPPSR